MTASPPNLFLISIDSLRADAFLQALERRGLTPHTWPAAPAPAFNVHFETAISHAPYTTAAVPALLTGRLPSRLPLMRLVGDIPGVLTRGQPTIATLLKAGGYVTAGFHSNPLLSRVFGFHEGFDHFFDDLLFQSERLPASVKLMLNRHRRLTRALPYVPAGSLNREVLAWINRQSGPRPIFVWVHYMDPHGPYQPARGRWNFIQKWRAEMLWRKAVNDPQAVTAEEEIELQASYHQEVDYTLDQVEALLNRLAGRGLLENAVIALTADHGDEFRERNGFTHRHLLYEELIRVPLLLRIPDFAPQTERAPVPLASVVPTLLAAAGLPDPAITFDGPNLMPLLQSGDRSVLPEFIVSEADQHPIYHAALRSAEWKLVVDSGRGVRQLFYLAGDPGERRDLADEQPQRVQEMEARLSAIVDTRGAGLTVQIEGGDAELETRLRSLGYIE